MPIRIDRVGDGYVAEVTPPHGGGIAWASPAPLAAEELARELTDRGCHLTDVADALHDAGWRP
jgi:hypothetical protein